MIDIKQVEGREDEGKIATCAFKYGYFFFFLRKTGWVESDYDFQVQRITVMKTRKHEWCVKNSEKSNGARI